MRRPRAAILAAVAAVGVVGLFLALISFPVGRRAYPAQQATTEPATRPASSRPAGPVLFQPGVWIDWQQREVLVQTRVVLRQAELEFLACWPGKEHESIVRFEAGAVPVYMALGLLGVAPGRPPVWNEEHEAFDPPTGGLIDISFRWDSPDGPRTVDAYDWLREIEYARTPLRRPWYFCGSVRQKDGSLSCEPSGEGIAVVDCPDSLISFSRRYPRRWGQLWVEINTPAIPPEGTPVKLVLRPAQPRDLRVELDFRGVAWLDGRYCSLPDLSDLIGLQRQLRPDYVQVITTRDALPSDCALVNRALLRTGLPAGAFRVVPAASP